MREEASGEDEKDVDVHGCFHVTYVPEMRGGKHCSEQHLDQGSPWKKQGNGALKVL